MAVTVAPISPDSLRGRLEEIRAEVEDVLERRNNLFRTARAELIASGIDAEIVSVNAAPGDKVAVYEEVWHWPDGRGDSTHTRASRLGGRRDLWGPYQVTELVFAFERGVYDVIVVDGRDALVAKVPGLDDEPGHRRAVGRLRRLAKSEYMRVRVRDREITLLSPMNDIVHVGDVNTAYAWLCGIELADHTRTER